MNSGSSFALSERSRTFVVVFFCDVLVRVLVLNRV